MFFVLSKILVYLIYPFSWIFILLLISFFVKKEKIKKLTLGAAIIISLIFSETVIFNFFMDWWEPDAVPIEKLDKKYDFVIVLGGIATYDSEGQKIIPRYAADRLLQAIKLYKQKKANKIFISGGNASLFGIERIPEADFLKKYLTDIGISDRDIIIEDSSRNTHENAVFTYQIFKRNKWLNKKVILLTSAYHMRRAEACFKKAGFKNFDIFPVDHYGGKLVIDYHQMILPKVEILSYWNILIKEWVGMIMYKVANYI